MPYTFTISTMFATSVFSHVSFLHLLLDDFLHPPPSSRLQLVKEFFVFLVFHVFLFLQETHTAIGRQTNCSLPFSYIFSFLDFLATFSMYVPLYFATRQEKKLFLEEGYYLLGS